MPELGQSQIPFDRESPGPSPSAGRPLTLRVTLDVRAGAILFDWSFPATAKIAAQGRLVAARSNEFISFRTLEWQLEIDGRLEADHCGAQPASTAALLKRIRNRIPLPGPAIRIELLTDTDLGLVKAGQRFPVEMRHGADPWKFLGRDILDWARLVQSKNLPPAAVGDTRGRVALYLLACLRLGVHPMSAFNPGSVGPGENGPVVAPVKQPVAGLFDFEARMEMERQERRLMRKEQRRQEEEARRREVMARLALERESRERNASPTGQPGGSREAAKGREFTKGTAPVIFPASPGGARQLQPPPVSMQVRLSPLVFQETALPLADLRNYSLRERAALWWVSNQSDDLLCLPNCRIERLEYQIRAALRVLGPLRGRALLSDEVGLGKTIEAGLIIKELLTRGMAHRFLVLTLPSLVDQWAEELGDKFGLATVTTNDPAARSDPEQFWRGNTAIVASLHTLKQPAQLQIARQVHWDILVVDEAHHVRSSRSQAWQAVNVLPRQFLLLLTATPVQNSLEDLYNLVTLLQPGQLPSPKEFRARYIDPKSPRVPREPEVLRRLLSQVMIRNTRSNAGIELPPRQAETVLFEPEPEERVFWERWDGELRKRLEGLNPSQAGLWGRLLLQTAGSSPAAWRASLAKFPDESAARGWSEQAPLEPSWGRKCALIVPLARFAGGVVVFTQFLETQAALAQFLRGADVKTFVVNGATPAAERQPIVEDFRRNGGALILTHSGTEGRNLQFCHHLVNFDLPWNPMEIEQRIGRLHRIGQRQAVCIHNFVQAGTLQEHLLHILQEKLNLFELVVGETGLVLGDRFDGDEFAVEVFRRWRESKEGVAAALAGLGDELTAAREQYAEVKKLDTTLFAKDYESD